MVVAHEHVATQRDPRRRPVPVAGGAVGVGGTDEVVATWMEPQLLEVDMVVVAVVRASVVGDTKDEVVTGGGGQSLVEALVASPKEEDEASEKADRLISSMVSMSSAERSKVTSKAGESPSCLTTRFPPAS